MRKGSSRRWRISAASLSSPPHSSGAVRLGSGRLECSLIRRSVPARSLNATTKYVDRAVCAALLGEVHIGDFPEQPHRIPSLTFDVKFEDVNLLIAIAIHQLR